MNILYITGIDVNIKRYSGIFNKVLGQAEALSDNHNCVYIGFDDGKTFIISKGIKKEKIAVSSNWLTYRIKKYAVIPNWIQEHNIDAVYIRYDGLEPIILNALKKIKRQGVRIILELPTYPLTGEIKTRLKGYLHEKKYFKLFLSIVYVPVPIFSSIFAHLYIDRIVTYMQHDEIWGVPVTEIDNGIAVKQIPVNKKTTNNKSNIIFACIANISEWHGLDRMIEGLALYQNQEELQPIFWVIGEGSELDYLKSLVIERKITDKVKFMGSKAGQELDEIMNRVDIGVGSLGLHRIGLYAGSTLKTKEYCARGIPFIYAYDEKQLTENDDYALRIPADNLPVDINQIMDFAKRVMEDQTISERMRNDALERYDWSVQMRPVIEYLQEK